MDHQGRDALKHVTIYTDGACFPNPGPGGYGVVLLHGRHRREIAGGYALTTNNRMELLAAIIGLETLNRRCRVTLHSDSQYLVDAMAQGWVRRWRANHWWRNKDERALNSDLWERLLTLCDEHEIEFVWVRGHAGDPENERCDQLACEACGRADLPADSGYLMAKLEACAGKVKMTHEGQPCRKCETPVVRKAPRTRSTIDRPFHYEWYLYCPGCGTQYMVEEAKRPGARQIATNQVRLF